MNLSEYINDDKALSVVSLLKGGRGEVSFIHIQSGQSLKEHKSPVDALLVCLKGKVIYSEANGRTATLREQDFVRIPAEEVHKLDAEQAASLLLLK